MLEFLKTMSEKGELTSIDIYRNQLEQYHVFRRKIEGTAAVQLGMDKTQERLHRMHIKLLKCGEMIGKNQAEVLMDFILLDGNLAEYNLPDMAVQEINIESSMPYYYHLISRNGQDVSRKFIGVTIYSVRGKPEFHDGNTGKVFSSMESYTAYQYFLKDWLGKPHVFIPYYGYWGGGIFAKDTTPAFGLKQERLRVASHDLNVDVFSKATPSNPPEMHWPLQLTGLVVPAERLEEVATKISNNKDRYWITERESSDLFNPDILKHDETDQLYEYFGDLSFKMLGIREPKSKDWRGWISLLSVVSEMKKRGIDPEDVFKWNREVLKKVGDLYIPDVISQEAQKLRRLGKKEQALTLESKLKDLMQKM